MDNPGATVSRTVLLTRPEPSSRHFAGLLSRARPGIPVIVSPLMSIKPIEADLPDADVLVFTSANAPACAGPGFGRAAYCVGDATAAAAEAAGYAAVSLGGDADGLVLALLDARPKGLLLHARGAFARGAVAERLSNGGLTVMERVVYEQVGRPLSGEARGALARPLVAPLFSPRSAAQFAPYAGYARDLKVVAMSAAVADAVGGSSSHLVDIVETPTAKAMLEGILLAARDSSAPGAKPNENED